MSHSRPDIKHVSHRLVTRRTILDDVKLGKEVDNKFLIMDGAYILVIASDMCEPTHKLWGRRERERRKRKFKREESTHAYIYESSHV